MENHLYCGAAKRNITPAPELLPDLRGLQDRHFGGVMDDLYLRVIALKNGEEQALLICFELDKVPHPQRLLEMLEAETGVKQENILLTAVHTHSAPITGDRPFEGPNNIATKPAQVQEATHAYEAFLEESLRSAAREAVEHMVPARMGIGTGESYINVSRNQWYEYRDGQGKVHRKCALGANRATTVDRTVYVVKFEDLEGRSIAFFINYPVHCCVLHTNQCCNGLLAVSGDIAGRVSKYMEQDWEGAVALWCSGAAGDINPIMQNEIYYPDPVTGDMVTEIMPGDNRSLLTMMANNHFDDVKRTAAGIVCGVTDVSLSGCVEWSRTPGMEGDYEVRLHMMRIGKSILFGASGELYSVYARQLKKLIPAENVIVINHDASLFANSGYILEDEALLMPEVDLPGVAHTNMKPGYFSGSLLEHAAHMYESLIG